MFRHILIATDGSELAAEGVDTGLDLAHQLKAKVTIVTASEPWLAAVGDAAPAFSFPVAEYDKAAAENAQGILAAAAAAAKQKGVACETVHALGFPEEWLLIEWPKGEKEPTKYWLSTLPEDISFHRLVDYAKLRWRIEHDYLELKQEVGLGDFEGRGWRGFHHHATMSIAVYGFLISERGAFPPSGSIAKVLFSEFALPKSYRPRGSAAAA